jgi:hypothetical protein
LTSLSTSSFRSTPGLNYFFLPFPFRDGVPGDLGVLGFSVAVLGVSGAVGVVGVFGVFGVFGRGVALRFVGVEGVFVLFPFGIIGFWGLFSQ